MSTILLDTNVLPTRGPVRTVIISSLLQVASARGSRIVLPSLVVDESVNMRRDNSAKAVGKVREALAEASRYFELESVYLPDPSDVADEWRRELTETFAVVNVDPGDALEALQREALRKAPASNGVGARDSAIWLTALRLMRASTDEHIYLVSNNVADFADETKSNLDPRLAEELAEGEDGRLTYVRSLHALLAQLAEPFEYTPSVDAFRHIDHILMNSILGSDALDDLTDPELADAWLNSDSVGLHSIEHTRTIKAYTVDQKAWLAWVELRVLISFDTEDSTLATVAVLCRVWLELESQAGPIRDLSLDRIESVTSEPSRA
jgi:hypothetical protein